MYFVIFISIKWVITWRRIKRTNMNMTFLSHIKCSPKIGQAVNTWWTPSNNGTKPQVAFRTQELRKARHGSEKRRMKLGQNQSTQFQASTAKSSPVLESSQTRRSNRRLYNHFWASHMASDRAKSNSHTMNSIIRNLDAILMIK